MGREHHWRRGPSCPRLGSCSGHTLPRLPPSVMRIFPNLTETIIRPAKDKNFRQRPSADSPHQEDYDRFLFEQTPQLSVAEKARIQALASDIPTLWHAPQ